MICCVFPSAANAVRESLIPADELHPSTRAETPAWLTSLGSLLPGDDHAAKAE